MVRLNLSYKYIANVMNIRHQRVFPKKYRIAQKMKVEGDTGFQQVILETLGPRAGARRPGLDRGRNQSC